ncbi:hypothetical protein GT347_09320 [Xylophilus rhododendri]|uniref:Uncharacterized protein n=1 Tax=Xylophilus rhododendri TaxID=2697032 RepID=A0A857J2L4_9BURK|nr:hypothetical protein [Xylophilus rhododendri]QHI98170.1 hypothetical protein GT347_09320 [Xylophilus rhododendri]
MHIEIVNAGLAQAFHCPEMQLAGGEPGRVRPQADAHLGLAADTVRPLGSAWDTERDGPAMIIQVDGQTVVEMAGFDDSPGVVLEGGGWIPAGRPYAGGGLDPAEAPSFFGQATNDRTPLLGGTAQAGSVVMVGVGGALFCVTASAAGTWSLDTASVAPMSGSFDLGEDGEKRLVVTSIDAQGHSCGVAGVFTLNTRPPQPPVLESLVVGSATPVLAGTAEPGISVMVGVGGAVFRAQADEQGRWSLDTAVTLPGSGTLHLGAEGFKTVVMACTDAAGNTSHSEGRFVLRSAPPRMPHALPEQGAERAAPQLSSPLLHVADATRNLLAGLATRRSGGQRSSGR